MDPLVDYLMVVGLSWVLGNQMIYYLFLFDLMVDQFGDLHCPIFWQRILQGEGRASSVVLDVLAVRKNEPIVLALWAALPD